MALPVIEQLLNDCSLEDILITFFSPSGYTQAAKGKYASRSMYVPLDSLPSVRQFYKDYAPQNAIFIRYDFWYNLICEGQNRGTHFYLVNGRFQENHFMFKWYGRAYLNLLKGFKRCFTSDVLSTQLLKENGVNAKFTGDTRFDRVAAIARSATEYDEIATYKGNRKLLMVGSSWAEEEELILNLLRSKPDDLAIIIAPHDLKRSIEIAHRLAEFKPKKYTDSTFSADDTVLILDTMGMLSSMYQYADFALIGGGFSGALHNILEPAVWGCHISFGPNVFKFPEAQAFVDEGFAYKITHTESWTKDILQHLNGNTLDAISKKAASHVQNQMGATSIVIGHLG